jgi:hypothetical protein
MKFLTFDLFKQIQPKNRLVSLLHIWDYIPIMCRNAQSKNCITSKILCGTFIKAYISMAITTEIPMDLTKQSDTGAVELPKDHNLEKNSAARLVAQYRPRIAGLLVYFSYVLVALFIYAGWKQRLQWPLTAESGAGYLLGIIGATMMLLLLLYPLRKHSRYLRNMGPVKYWFRLHMLFGVAGPVLILFHSGFQLGSLNSSIALFSMLLVAGSGLIGRYFYIRIHHGLYGRKATLEELQQHSDLLKQSLSESLQTTPWILDRIKHFEARITPRSGNLISSLWKLLSVGIRTRLLFLMFRITADSSLTPSGKRQLVRHIGAHLSSIRKMAEFHFYERLFSIWHIVHLPLFLMLILTGVVHVIAVHMY